jgi:hypothetical protein
MAMTARIVLANVRTRKAACRTPTQTVLLAGIEVPGRENDLARVIERILESTRHNVSVATTRMRPVGKFENINSALLNQDLSGYDWLLVIDDDIEVPDRLLDLLIYFSEKHNLKLAQPAHKFKSHKSFTITERHWGSQARNTQFIESGPVSLFHRDTFPDLIPFPALRWTWGIDVYWADMAKRRGWRMGIVDAAPIRHLRPVGGSYDMSAARKEAIDFLKAASVRISREEVFRLNCRIS